VRTRRAARRPPERYGSAWRPRVAGRPEAASLPPRSGHFRGKRRRANTPQRCPAARPRLVPGLLDGAVDAQTEDPVIEVGGNRLDHESLQSGLISVVGGHSRPASRYSLSQCPQARLSAGSRSPPLADQLRQQQGDVGIAAPKPGLQGIPPCTRARRADGSAGSWGKAATRVAACCADSPKRCNRLSA